MSSLASHFGTNYAPTDDELTEIRGLLIAPSARLVELDAEMEQKLAEYNAIVEKRAKVKQEIADYRALVSPMRRFPVDLLREIFLHCLPTNHNAILSRNKAPVLLTQVCSHWRIIVLDTPALWASLHIPVPPPISNVQRYSSDLGRERYKSETADVIKMRKRAMQEWLARSGACRLDISLHDMDRSIDTSSNTNYKGFLDTLILHSKRWRSMTFTTSVDYLKRIAALTVNDVPALEELAINMTSYFIHGDEGPSIAIVKWADSSLLSASRLHRVSFNNISENINLLPIRWQQLTHLSLTGMLIGGENMSLAKISALLPKCPGLISARLEIAYPAEHTGTAAGQSQFVCTSPIVLLNLVDLSLRNGGTDPISSFFAILDVPRLTTLEYHNDLPAETADEFIAFLTRVSESLINFTTNPLIFSRSDFFAILKAARRLKSLSSRRGGHPTNQPDTWVPHELGVSHFDDVFLGMLVGKCLGQPNSNTERTVTLEERRIVEEVAEGYSRILLPDLENFGCRLPAHFTDEGLLACLKLRQSLGRGTGHTASSSISNAEERMSITHTAPYTKFKRFSVTLARRETRPMLDEIASFRQAGLALSVSHTNVGLGNSLSPAQGIIAERVPDF